MKPECVIDCNKRMSGIDKADQMMVQKNSIMVQENFLLSHRCVSLECLLEENRPKLELLTFKENIIYKLLKVEMTKLVPSKEPQTQFHCLEPVPETPKNRSPVRQELGVSPKLELQEGFCACSEAPNNPLSEDEADGNIREDIQEEIVEELEEVISMEELQEALTKIKIEKEVEAIK
ncbi:hypothetical protein ILUMI_22479 [Ignelater luminosus]|uniref:Uncharacterized protein n=1 Tax=Ignelater luminosus TaxID=2038154 RepID=A0A8K0G2K8_IGNLU|nr:hypothetical protein ILUMI_22479 [Ignelater luminosus]